MPVYEFDCNACQKTFTKILTIAEHDKEPPLRQHKRGAALGVRRDL